jgi:DNA-binding CsgD family transcriptional regulator
MGFYKLLEDGTFKNIFTPFLDLKNALISPFDNIYVKDPENVFIGTQNGLVHYDPTISKNFFYPTSVYINQVGISSKEQDSLWYASGNMEMDKQVLREEFSIPYAYNHLFFSFNSPDLENAGRIEYSYRLVNFDEDWSEWSETSSKEYTNLRENSYVFEVRARNSYNNISQEDQFHFMVRPPWYRSTKAYLLYLLAGSGIIFLLVITLLRRMEKIRIQEKSSQLSAFQKKEEHLQNQKIAAEKEVIQLRNEKLRAEMKHKNKELATSTFHIIQKNKFLHTLQEELSKLSKKAKSELVEEELKKISRKIDRDIQNEKNWEVFDRYFDDVHQEFLGRLKEIHPELTPNELRLSAYLRMNISTKEIAPLMNISVRGAEISRYRLRKKLHLKRDENLTEYILKI